MILGAEDVPVILLERAHPHDAVQRARRLVAVILPELGQAQRQVAIAPRALAEHHHRAGTVHRLERQRFLVLVDADQEHMGAVIVPVP